MEPWNNIFAVTTAVVSLATAAINLAITLRHRPRQGDEQGATPANDDTSS